VSPPQFIRTASTASEPKCRSIRVKRLPIPAFDNVLEHNLPFTILILCISGPVLSVA